MKTPDSLAGTWRLLSMGDSPPLEGTRLEIEFRTDGTLSGYAGCNRLAASFSLESGCLKVTRLQISARACPPEILAQERRFVAALSKADQVRREARRLVLSAAGMPELHFEAVE